jgi:ribosome-associated protein
VARKNKDDETNRPDGDTRKPRAGSASGARSARPATGSSRGPRAARPAGDRPRIRATHGSSSIDTGYRGESGAPSKPRAPGRGPAGARRGLDRTRPLPGRFAATPAKKPARAATAEPQTAQARGDEPRAQRAPAKRRSVAPPPEPSTAAKELAIAIAAAGLDKKALGIEVLDVTGRVDYADFLVIMTGSSDRHVHAIASGIEEALSKQKLRPLSIEGLGAGTWVLIDYDDVVVHVFQEESRRVYDIEGLWMDARRIEIAEPVRR